MNKFLFILVILIFVGCSKPTNVTGSVNYPSVLRLSTYEEYDRAYAKRYCFQFAGEYCLPLQVLLAPSFFENSQYMRDLWEDCQKYNVKNLTISLIVDENEWNMMAPEVVMAPEVDESVPFEQGCNCSRNRKKLDELLRPLRELSIPAWRFWELYSVPLILKCAQHKISYGEILQECDENLFYCPLRIEDATVVMQYLDAQKIDNNNVLSVEQVEQLAREMSTILRAQNLSFRIIIVDSWTFKARYEVNKNGFWKLNSTISIP